MENKDNLYFERRYGRLSSYTSPERKQQKGVGFLPLLQAFMPSVAKELLPQIGHYLKVSYFSDCFDWITPDPSYGKRSGRRHCLPAGQ